MNTNEYQQLMAELKAEYLASFPTKFTILQKYFDDKNWKNLELEFHKLKGTGKTYGVPEVSTLCQKMEDLCAQGESKISASFDKAVALLKAIQQAYLNDETFNLEEDPRYSEILALVK